MRRDWDLIRGLLSAIDIDYDTDKRHLQITGMVAIKGIRSVNYHLCLLFEAGLVKYYKPLYSEDSCKLETKPVQLTEEGVRLLRLMRDDEIWTEATSHLFYNDHISASQNVLIAALEKHFLNQTVAS